MIEEKLKEIIVQKFGSVKRFSSIIDIPYTTLDSILKRGINNANVVNIIKICNKLNIDVEELASNNKIVDKDNNKKYMVDVDLDHNHKLDAIIMGKSKELTEEDKKKLIDVIDMIFYK